MYPAQIENKIYELDSVQDCLVYEYGQELYVEILPRAEVVKTVDTQELTAYYEEQIKGINQTLAPYERIQKVIVRSEDFVRSPAMKVLRSQNGKK